jgi:3-hydroxy-3-methylglutaryl CoA synthase
MSSTGITGFGAYIPRLRIDRSHIAAAHAWMAPTLKNAARGSRAFCSWDEDAITMAVEAGRDCLRHIQRDSMRTLSLASTTLPFADLQNSAIVAGALQMNNDIESLDIGHSQRAGTSGLIQALQKQSPALFIAADNPQGKPASIQELSYGAGAVAFTVGTQGVLAECLGTATVTENFADHFRTEGEKYGYFWEERWVRDEGILKLVPQAVTAALAKAGTDISQVAHLVIPPILAGAAKVTARKLGFEGKLADDLAQDCGYAGTAHTPLMLANTLEQAAPGELILVVGFGQGADAIVLRATEQLAEHRVGRGVAGSLADRLPTDSYLRMLSFQGGIDLEWGMRAEKSGKTILSQQHRTSEQTEGFNAGRCGSCQTVQFPQLQYCVNTECRAPASGFEQLSLVDQPCQVFTYTSDWLSYHPAPPLHVGFIQFDNGARLLMEMVDIAEGDIDVGTPMRHVFRVKDIDRQQGYRRYFWKATPISSEGV